MKNLIKEIENLKKSKVKKLIEDRISEFKDKKTINKIFKELCFCILTANSTAERCIGVHSKVGDGFLDLPKSKLQKKLKQHGCRFHTKRAEYIVEARKYKSLLSKALETKKGNELRGWLIDNIKGMGYKEASHFLRNIGYDDFAIIDFHIIDVLARHNLIEKPKNLNKQKYLEIENLMKELTNKTNLNLAELDLYLWFSETGKVLK